MFDNERTPIFLGNFRYSLKTAPNPGNLCAWIAAFERKLLYFQNTGRKNTERFELLTFQFYLSSTIENTFWEKCLKVIVISLQRGKNSTKWIIHSLTVISLLNFVRIEHCDICLNLLLWARYKNPFIKHFNVLQSLTFETLRHLSRS